jgi:hypothetical protein
MKAVISFQSTCFSFQIAFLGNKENLAIWWKEKGGLKGKRKEWPVSLT